MLIENPDAFKTWLTSILEPLCDADPAALAKYVYALVKKDKPLDDLREGMLDQLDVFLQQDTKPFVDMLFKALETNEYLKVELKLPSPTPEASEPEKEPEPNPEHASNGVTLPLPLLGERPPGNASARSPPAPPAPRHRVVVSRQTGGGARHAAPAPPPPPPPPLHARVAPPPEHTLVKVMPLTELLEEPIDVPRRRGDRVMRDKDDRRRRRSRSWTRRTRRHVWRDLSPHANEARRYEAGNKRRPQSRSPSPRGRYRNKSPPPPQALMDRPPSRSRSRSPIQMRDHERERDRLRIPREMERDRMSRDREHRDRISRSRDRDRSRERSRERSHSAGTPTQEQRDAVQPPPSHNHFKRRCRDFDERGFCVRGDFCQWDHGLDPLVLDQTTIPPNLSRVLDMVPTVPEYNPLAPDIWSGGYPNYPVLPPPRELVPIPRVRDVPPPMTAAMPPLAPPHMAMMRHPPPMNKKPFDYNKLGGMRPPMGINAANCSLEVKKVPRGMNDITHLNNHFGKFGKIVNIQVCFEGDPEGALITFSNHTEANVAYKSTEAVLNNRFIKVFWHNPESKQENVPPGGAGGAGPAGGAAAGAAQHKPTHPASQNKVLINKDNMKASADIRAADDKAREEAAAKMAAEGGGRRAHSSSQMYSRAHTLLETQLQQQVLLIQRLESGNVTDAQKKELMSAVQTCQEGIEKLRKELLAYNKAMQAAKARKPRTREDAQKEILDAELDLFTKQQEGQDVTDLLKKVGELRRQMSLQFPSHPAPRRPHPRGARFSTGARFTRAPAPVAPKGHYVNQSVDHRPRALLVSGFESDEVDAVVAHFSQFGEIVGKEVNAAVPELTLQYRVRAHAELAVARAKHYNDRTLSITWVMNNKPITPVATPAAVEPAERDEAAEAVEQNGNGLVEETPEKVKDAVQVTTQPSEDALLRFDEEEEEDTEEDRSWRR